jgi:hypothetical protein
LVSFNAQNRNDDVVTDDKFLSNTPCQNEHNLLSFGFGHIMRPRNITCSLMSKPSRDDLNAKLACSGRYCSKPLRFVIRGVSYFH